jgi:hypothetical protein
MSHLPLPETLSICDDLLVLGLCSADANQSFEIAPVWPMSLHGTLGLSNMDGKRQRGVVMVACS